MTGTINVYVIFYGDGSTNKYYSTGTGTSSSPHVLTAKGQSVLNFVTDLGSSSWWKVAQLYSGSTGSVGSLSVSTSYMMVDCVNNYEGSSFGCDLSGTNPTSMLGSLFRNNNYDTRLPVDSNGVYLFMLAPEVFEAFQNSGSGVLNGRDYCGYHSYFYYSGATNSLDPVYHGNNANNVPIRYALVGTPNSASISVPGTSIKKGASNCFFTNYNGVSSPNGDPQLDHAMEFVAHGKSMHLDENEVR